MYLSSVPFSSKTISVIGVRYSLRKSASFSGDMCSESEVKPRMSEKSTVSSRFSPRLSFSGFFSASSITSSPR